MIQMLGVGCS